MGSILQDIDTAINESDIIAENRVAIDHAVCYFAYCTEEHILDTKRPLWSYEAYIELPDCDLLRLEKLGYIHPWITNQRNIEGRTIRDSVYFYQTMYVSSIQATVQRFRLDDKLKDEYFEFCKKDKDYKKLKVEQFLNDISSFIAIQQHKYYSQLACCC